MLDIVDSVRKGLPFTGSKKNEYSAYIRNIIGSLVLDCKILDGFGGSGYLSANIKLDFPKHNVTLNDFDGLFINNLAERSAIAEIKVKEYLNNKGLYRRGAEKLDDSTAKMVRDVLEISLTEDDKQTPFIFNLVLRPYLYSAKTTAMFSRFDRALSHVNYIRYIPDGCQRLSYCDFIKSNCDNIISKDIFTVDFSLFDVLILDPPYLNSTQKSYSNAVFFGLDQTINLIRAALKFKDKKILLFNQNERDMRALLNLFDAQIISLHSRKSNLFGDCPRKDCLFYIQT